MNDPKKRITKLLDDSPALEDAFGSHKRIADSILELVRTEIGGKAIALVGSWGSGKSTVVKQLQAGTESENDTQIFVFDAWVHEGDPLRRAFLETLISHLQEKKWIDKERWDKKLEKLANKCKTTTTESSPVITLIGAILVLLAYLAPIGLLLADDHDKFYHHRTALYFGFILYFLPILVLPIRLIYGIWKKEDITRKNWYKFFSLLADKQTEKTETETFETPDPTSVEFQKVFEELLNDALISNRKLLLVIDNLGPNRSC